MANPAGWYKDPYSEGERFWDGYAWTSETRMGEESSKGSGRPLKKIFILIPLLVLGFLLFLFIKGQNEPAPVNSNFIFNTSKAEPKNIAIPEQTKGSSGENTTLNDFQPSAKASSKPSTKTTSVTKPSAKASPVRTSIEARPTPKPSKSVKKAAPKPSKRPKPKPTSTKIIP